MRFRSKGSLYEINCEPKPDPGPGRRRLEITAKYKGQVIWHKAGPSNIVLGLHRKFLEKAPWPRLCPYCGMEIPAAEYHEHTQECERRHG